MTRQRGDMGDASNTVTQIVSGTGDPAFAVDPCGRILAWNDAAEQFLGYSCGEVNGERCFEVLAGRDVFGNRFCSPTCPVRDMAHQNELVNRFAVSFRSASGALTPTGVTVLVIPDGSSPRVDVVHLLQPLSSLAAGPQPPDGADDLAMLTLRENEVLRLLADGKNTDEIAADLFICATTVRHHVQSMMRKLGVHSRLQAVAVLNKVASS